jgi:hypothetical protein
VSKEIELTQGQVAIVDDEDFERAKGYNWCAMWRPKENAFWAHAYVQKGEERIWMSLQRFILGDPKGWDVCFRTDNPLDCRRNNLCVATRQEVAQKQRISRKNRSGFKGVSWDAQTNRWRADIGTDGKTRNLGRFNDLIDAALAYDEAARALFGEYARLNFADKGEQSALRVMPSSTGVESHPKKPRRQFILSRANTSGYKGVAWDNHKCLWQANISISGKQRNLGRFNDPIKAANAYDEAARESFGKHASFNFPRPGELSARADIPLKPAA